MLLAGCILAGTLASRHEDMLCVEGGRPCSREAEAEVLVRDNLIASHVPFKNIIVSVIYYIVCVQSVLRLIILFIQ